MRLYLSSFRLGDHPEHLLRMVAEPHARVAVIANAIDVDTLGTRAESVEAEIAALTELGLVADELDLRHYVRDPDGLAQTLAAYRAVWVRGGNAFVLRYAMARSGADEVLTALVRDGSLVYAGYSAGPCVLAPSLRGLELCDEPELIESEYGAEITWDGLGLLDRPFVPHLDSPGHPETELVARVAQHYRELELPFWPLRDGQVLLVEDATSVLV